MSSLKGKPIYWSQEKNSSQLSFVPGVDVKSMSNRSNQNKRSIANQKQQMILKSKRFSSASKKIGNHENVKNTKSSGSTDMRISLKDLCPEDKERVANLVRELAKAGEEKQASEIALNTERKQFALKLEELKSDKKKIEQEQRTLLSEFKECQRLLVFYQQKITEEQKEVARDINRLLADTSINKSKTLSSPRKSTLPCEPIHPPAEPSSPLHLDHDVIVRDPDVTLSSRRSGVESLNASRQFLDVAGDLGESFRHEKTSFNRSEAASDSSMFVKIGKSSNKKNSSTGIEAKRRPGRDIDVTKAFEERIRALSPNGRRLALLRQKRDLENEQLHLQKLLSEQEELLKFRQEELKKRHIEYTRRMRHYKQFGSFPSNQPIIDVNDRDDQISEPIMSEYNEGSSETLNESSEDTTPRIDIGSPRRQTRFQRKSYTEPLPRSKKLDQSSTGSDVIDRVSSSFLSSRNDERRCRIRSNYIVTPINDVTNLSPTTDRTRNRSLVGESTLTSNLKRSFADEMFDNSSAITGNDRSRRPLRSTMNNISTLSDLVSSVETSTSHNTSYLPPQSEDTAASTTFDPEDSQLLEDIFFIK